MHKGRIYTIAMSEVRFIAAHPIFWILLVVLGMLTLSLGPAVFIPSEPSPGGESVWINSRYALLQFYAFSGLLGYTVFASLLAGLSLMRDADAGIAPIMNSTPLSPAEYVVGKMVGIGAMLGLAVLWHVGVTMLAYELMPSIQRELGKGPFNAWHYLSMAVLGAVPGIGVAVSLTFMATALTRRSLVVYAVPVLVFIATMSYALVTPTDTSWSLPVMLLDPSGIRWMFHTVFETDQGVAYYNTAPIAIDAIYLSNRLIMLGIGVLSILVAILSTRRWMRHPDKRLLPHWVIKNRRRFSEEPQEGKRIPTSLPLMQRRSSPHWKEVLYIAVMEWKQAMRQPIYYLVGLVLIGLLVDNANESASSILGTSLYLTAGTISVSNLPLLSGFLCILVLMFAVEASFRDRRATLDSVVRATPVRSSSFVMGRLLAGVGLVMLVLLVVVVVFLVQLQSQGAGFVSVYPFVISWGGVLMPSLVLWLACVLLIAGASKQWATAYAFGLMLLAVSIYVTLRGWVDWSTNWLLWGSLRWSDMGGLVQDQRALILNRTWVLLLAGLITSIAVIRYRRVVQDQKQAPRKASLLPLRTFKLPGIVALTLSVVGLMGYTRSEVHHGFQGSRVEQQDKAYWQQNMQTWRDYEPPNLVFMDLAVDLTPASRYMAIEGAYTLINRTNHQMEVLPVTMPSAFEHVTWVVNDKSIASEDRAGLHLLELDMPLAVGDSVQLGFTYEAYVPKGMSRNGGARSHFILPAGVLLSNARGDFLPIVGYEERRGVSEANRYDPADQDPRFTHLNDKEEPGVNLPFMSRIAITIPESYMATATGTQTSVVNRDGKQTTIWETQYPVRAINVMAGTWSVKERGTNAVYYHPTHENNADILLDALVDARTHYSAWFSPYPWGSLRINEFPNAGMGATAYPTNISFSEGMGFLTRPEDGAYLPYVVAAHEVAHQWWGHLVSPAYTPGADLLTEAMANYATARLLAVEKGDEARDVFLQWLNDRYESERRIDRELPLRELTLNTPDAESVIYNKGALVLWKMHQFLGATTMDAAIQEFMEAYAIHTGKQPGLDNFLDVVRTHAADVVGFDQFVVEWIDSVSDRPLLD